MAAEVRRDRALGMLVARSWRPKRTIVYAAWDGEEQGLLGSTEWMEQYADELRQKAVVYINGDGNSRGFLQVGGSHTLEHFVNGRACERASSSGAMPKPNRKPSERRARLAAK